LKQWLVDSQQIKCELQLRGQLRNKFVPVFPFNLLMLEQQKNRESIANIPRNYGIAKMREVKTDFHLPA